MKNRRCPVVAAATSSVPIPPAIFKNTSPINIKAILLRIVGHVRRQIVKVETGFIGPMLSFTANEQLKI
jgi:hypothetical protein